MPPREGPRLHAVTPGRPPALPDNQSYCFPGFDLSETAGDVPGPAPLLGGDNDIVFREFLGLTEEESESHVANGVI